MARVMAKDYRLDVARLLNPAPHFHHFVYDEKKIADWAYHLKNDPLYIEDDARNWTNILAYIGWVLFGDCMNITYEIGEGAGVLTFTAIVPNHKAKVDWYMWDKGLWSKSFARECKSVVDFIMDEFNLRRVWSNTAKPEIAKFVKSFGARVEGVKVGDFKFDGKSHDSYMLALTAGQED